ncbi:MAG: hypothetical protein ACRDU8_07535 [Egibacteraceae bacterium]
MGPEVEQAVAEVATPVLGHAKWFVGDPSVYSTDWAFALSPLSLGMVAAAVIGAVVWRLVSRLLPVPELAVLRPLGRLAPWIPRLLGVHLGVSLLSLAVTDSYLAPSLPLGPVSGGVVIALAEGVVGVWLITGVRLRGAALAVVALGPLGLALAGPVAVLEAADLLGIALFLALLPPGRDRWGARLATATELAWPVLVLRLCVGGALVVVAFSEKLANPQLTEAFLDRYPAFDLFRLLGLDLGPEAFIVVAAAVEVLFGLLLISGAAPQAAVIVAGIPFNATLFFLDRTELIGHLPIYGAMLALLVYGSQPGLAEAVPWFPGHRQPNPGAGDPVPAAHRRGIAGSVKLS